MLINKYRTLPTKQFTYCVSRNVFQTLHALSSSALHSTNIMKKQHNLQTKKKRTKIYLFFLSIVISSFAASFNINVACLSVYKNIYTPTFCYATCHSTDQLKRFLLFSLNQ